MNRKGQRVFVTAFLLPAGLLYLLFVLYPLIQTFALSAYKFSGNSSLKSWNFPKNYQWSFGSLAFKQSLLNSLSILVVGGLTIFVVSMVVAHGIQRSDRMSRALRSIFLFPQIISVVVVAVIWKFLYNPNHGLVNAALDKLGATEMKQPWIAQSSTALPAVTLVFVWWALGFYVMLFSAGLKAIPAEVGEAAELDGAYGLTRFWRVTWPMIWSIRRIALVYLVSNVLNLFALVYVMTQGGPDRATETMLTFLYQTGFEQSNFGRASALASINFVLAMALSFLVFLVSRKNPEVSR